MRPEHNSAGTQFLGYGVQYPSKEVVAQARRARTVTADLKSTAAERIATRRAVHAGV